MNDCRTGKITRRTNETSIEVEVNLDGTGRSDIETPLPFLSHMLDQVARHGRFDLTVKASGDVVIDGHHTTEDLGLALGKAFSEALGDRSGIRRFGEATIPLDDALCQVVVDFGGRPFFVSRLPLPKAQLGSFEVELCPVFLEAFARAGLCNLHVRLHEGENLHHILEATFKAFGRAIAQAVLPDPRVPGVPSTKGTLTE